jgi:hypothetical protein
MFKHAGESKPVLLADSQVAARYGICVRTLERWSERPDLGFPTAVRINRRRYRALAALEAWERAQAKSRGKGATA